MEKEYNGGYEIIRRKQVGKKEFVLAYNPNAAQAYATWKCNAGKSDYYWGHYFSDEQRAVNDFANRIREEKQYER